MSQLEKDGALMWRIAGAIVVACSIPALFRLILVSIGAGQLAFTICYRNELWEIAMRPDGTVIDNEPQRILDMASAEQIRVGERRLEMQLSDLRLRLRNYPLYEVGALAPQRLSLSQSQRAELGRLNSEGAELAVRLRIYRSRFVAVAPTPAVSIKINSWLLSFAFFVTCMLASRTRIRRSWRVRHGYCGNCGYDLRATNGRCPECGKRRTSETGTQVVSDLADPQPIDRRA